MNHPVNRGRGRDVLGRVIRYMLHYYKHLFGVVILCILVSAVCTVVGATFPQRVAQAILPSCLRGFLSWFLYCVEVNIRASTIVGMVGGGGVGLTLFSYIKSFRYDIALTIILLIAAMVIVVDQITGKLRKELLK